MDYCKICRNYIYDKISIDSHPNDCISFNIKFKNLKTNLGKISEELFKCLVRISESEFHSIIHTTNKCSPIISNSNTDLYFYTLYRCYELQNKNNELTYLFTYLEDIHLSNDPIEIKKLIGYWLYTLYMEIEFVHLEHLKIKENSFNGNPFIPIKLILEKDVVDDDLYI